MYKKILVSITIGIFIVIGFVFYYSQTYVINVDVPNLESHSTKLTLPYNESGALLTIQGAENRVSEAEDLLNQVKSKDLSEYSFLHRQFLENMIDLIEERLDTSKDRLDTAKDFLEDDNYQKAGEYASVSASGTAILPRHLNNILEGKEKKDWNKEYSEEECPVGCICENRIVTCPPENPEDYSQTIEVPIE